MQKKSKVLLLKISDAKAKTLIREAMEKSLPKGQSFSNIQHQAFGYMEVKDLFEQGLVPWYKSGILKIDKKDLEDIAGKVNSKIDLSMPTQATATTASNNEIMENASAAVGKNKRKFQPSSLSAGMQNESTSVNQNVSRVTRRGS